MNTAHRLAAQAKQRQFVQTQRDPVDLMQITKHRVATLTAEQQAELIAPYQAAIDALQFGKFNEQHFRMLADCFNVAEVLAQPPFNLANDHADKFNAAQMELYGLSEQFRDRRTWTTRAAQLQVLKDALEMHEIQVQFVSQAELLNAAARVMRRTREALAGRGGFTVVEALA